MMTSIGYSPETLIEGEGNRDSETDDVVEEVDKEEVEMDAEEEGENDVNDDTDSVPDNFQEKEVEGNG